MGEEKWGTDPNDPDTDDDCLTDGDETHELFIAPLFPDTDFDGSIDGVEVAAGTDPNDNEDIPGGDGSLGARCAAATVVKTVSGATPSGIDSFTFELRQGGSTTAAGTVLESGAANAANGGVLQFALSLGSKA